MTYEGSSSLVWEALGCLAGIDWTALFFWCLITFSLCLVSILLISIFLPSAIKEDDSSSPSEPVQPPQGLDVFRQLFSQKLLPIDSSSGWQLTGVHHELRSWQKTVEIRGSSFSLHGSSAIISSHSLGILDTLKDISKFLEWDTQVVGCSYISVPAPTDDTDHPLETDVLSLGLVPHRSVADTILDKILALLSVPYDFLSSGASDLTSKYAQKPAVVARSWKREADETSWMFSRTVFKGRGHTLDEVWSYSLAQPVTNDPDKSIMHHIICNPSSSKDSLQNEKPALRLAALKQYFGLKQLRVNPLQYSSLRHLASHTHIPEVEGHAKGTSAPDSSKQSSVRESHSHRNNFVASVHSPDTNGHSRDESHLLHRSLPTWPSDVQRPKPRSASEGRISAWQDNSSSDDAGFYSEKREAPHRPRRSKVKKTMSNEVGGGGDGRRSRTLERTIGEGGAQGLEDSGVIDNIADFQMTAEQGSDIVFQESSKAACINVNAPEDDQRLQTGGWSFHSLEKDVVILKKAKRGKYYSFLGKGIIKASPEAVSKAIKNPRTRFTYDTMLKKMDIVKTLSDDLCIYHMVHEVPQLLKKESRDFSVLQLHKKEGDSHIVSFRSVDHQECPEHESIVRGHVLPSGWVIEPVHGKDGQYSMVTYISQFALCGKEVPASFNQFLSVRVPLSVAYLRLFLEAQLP